MRTSILGLCLILVANALFAQNKRFTTEGVIEYEKKVNMYAYLSKRITKDNESFMQPAYDNFKRTQPQFKTMKSTLAFSKGKTMYTPIESAQTGMGFFGDDPIAMQFNTTFTDLSIGSSVNQKKVFEETFLVKDSVRKITWKITSETRDIAGYTCRRANAIVLDSIYVVAFYTDEIPVSGGPESFTGLPGMILGVALPHENTTWFATSVADRPVPAASLLPATKGKSVDYKGFRSTLQSALKDWGEYANMYLKLFML